MAFSWGSVALLPSQAYRTRYVTPSPTVGMALERQQGQHAFASDRVTPFDTWSGTLSITRAGVDVISESDHGGEYLVVTCDTLADADIDATLHTRDRRVAFGASAALQAAAQLRRHVLGADVEAIEEATMRFISASLATVRGETRHPSSSLDRRAVVVVLDLIESCLDEPLPIERLARAAGVPPLRFLREFTRCIGLTPHAYVIERRIQRARQWMASMQKRSMADIASACGFAHQSHLGAVMKRTLGVTPQQLKASMSHPAALRRPRAPNTRR